MSRIIPVNPEKPDEKAVEAAVEALNNGEIVIFPAETLYGLGVDAENEIAVKRLYKHKKRDADKPVPVIAADVEMVYKYAERPSAHGIRLMEKCWPGALTLVFKALPGVSPLLTGNTGTIGVRVSNSKLVCKLAQRLGRAITATSANYSGKPASRKVWEIPDRLIKAAELILHGGVLSGSAPSTVLSLAEDPPVILREGAVSRKVIEECILTDLK